MKKPPEPAGIVLLCLTNPKGFELTHTTRNEEWQFRREPERVFFATAANPATRFSVKSSGQAKSVQLRLFFLQQ